MAIKPEQCIVCFDNETELYKCDRCSAYMCNKCKIWLQNENNNTCLQCNLKPFNQTIEIQVEEEYDIILRNKTKIGALVAWASIFMIISGVAQILRMN